MSRDAPTVVDRPRDPWDTAYGERREPPRNPWRQRKDAAETFALASLAALLTAATVLLGTAEFMILRGLLK